MKAGNIIELLCVEVVELVTEYLSQSMAPEERARLEQHLLTCPPCTAYLGQVKDTLKVMHGLDQDTRSGGDVDETILALYRRWSGK